jgi:dihydrofolate synthase/folylpolyglutamate synthase
VQSFQNFLEAKPLYYKEIDHNRIDSAYRVLKEHIKHPQTIHIVGTNGKGSTGRAVAHLAYSSGLSVGHYSSPHIVEFNERIWIDGFNSSDKTLEVAHQRLYSYLGDSMSDSLSYFEYTTLLALVVFEDVDLIVLEAGLGGEWDATNISNKALSIITPIGIDHQAFLGESIEEIASTKIRSIQRRLLLAPQPYKEVEEVAQQIARDRGATIYTISDKNRAKVEQIAREKNWANYLVDNIIVALKALEILGIEYDIAHLLSLELFGRYYRFSDNITIDVGHNSLASKAIVEALDKEVVLVYNSLDDKDYKEILSILKPKIKRVEIIPIASQRATTMEEIIIALDKLKIEHSIFNGINRDKEYLIFGSFYVVEEFLRYQRTIP